MHLVVILGPMAVGKMTVGIELAELSGYRLFHHHMSIDALAGIFAWGSPSFNRLNGEIRRRVVEEAVISDLPGLIFTMVWDLDDPRDREFLDRVSAPVRTAGGRAVGRPADPAGTAGQPTADQPQAGQAGRRLGFRDHAGDRRPAPAEF